MYAFFISQFKPPTWTGEVKFKINPENYGRELKKLWPDAAITVPPLKEYVLWWELNREGTYQIMGGLQTDYNVVSVEGNEQYIAEFAIWHRAFVPQEYSLFLFHESLTINFALSSGMSIKEVLALII